jgi:hypothetical protein
VLEYGWASPLGGAGRPPLFRFRNKTNLPCAQMQRRDKREPMKNTLSENLRREIPRPYALRACLRGFLILIPAIFVCCLTGCYNHKFQSSTPPGVVKKAPSGHVPIGVVEFDDMGELFDRCDLSPQDDQPCQIMSVVDWIRIERARAEPDGTFPKYSVVVTFVHGWGNNADQSNDDLKQFTDELGVLKGNSSDVRYIGVYVGWRGSAWAVRQWYGYIPTVFNREAGARRVASVSATELLFRIRDAAKQSLGEGKAQGKFVLVGHSFGGLIVERTLAQALTALIVLRTDKTPPPDNCESGVSGPEPFADLAVLINPAIDAIETQQIIDMLKRSRFIICRKNSHFEAPLLVSIKARNDYATGGVFTFIHFLESGNKLFRDYGNAPALSSQADPKRPSQWSVYKNTAGNLPFLQNYCFIEKNDPGEKGCKKVSDEVNHEIQSPREGSRYRQAFVESPSPAPKEVVNGLYARYHGACNYSSCEVWNNTPYWIFTVPRDIVDSHGGWASAKFGQLLTEIILQTTMDESPKAVRFQ